MATLTISNTFQAGTPAVASEVNQNFQDIVNWSTRINTDNFDPAGFTGKLFWNITTNNVLAIEVSSAATEGIMSLTSSVSRAAGKPLLKLVDSLSQTQSGTNALFIESNGTATSEPVFRIKAASTNAPYLLFEDANANEIWKIDNNGNLRINKGVANTLFFDNVNSRLQLLDTNGKLFNEINAYSRTITLTDSSETARSRLVVKDTDGYAYLEFDSSATSDPDAPIIRVQKNGTAHFRVFNRGKIFINSDSSGSGQEFLRCFDSNGAEKFRIDTAGNIPIAGGITANGDVNINAALAVSGVTTTNGDLRANNAVLVKEPGVNQYFVPVLGSHETNAHNQISIDFFEIEVNYDNQPFISTQVHFVHLLTSSQYATVINIQNQLSSGRIQFDLALNYGYANTGYAVIGSGSLIGNGSITLADSSSNTTPSFHFKVSQSGFNITERAIVYIIGVR